MMRDAARVELWECEYNVLLPVAMNASRIKAIGTDPLGGRTHRT